MIISLLNARVGFSLTGFAMTNVGVALAMLALLPYTTGNFSVEFCYSVAQTIGLVILLPVMDTIKTSPDSLPPLAIASGAVNGSGSLVEVFTIFRPHFVTSTMELPCIGIVGMTRKISVVFVP